MNSNICRPMRRLFYWPLMFALLSISWSNGWAQSQKTLVADSLYKADGSAASGTLLISWPAFTSANGDAVAAGSLNVKIGTSGTVRVSLFANTGSSPASSYKVTLKLSDGTTSEEYWTIPATATTTIGAVRSKVVPAAVAQQFVGRDYVDTKLSQFTVDTSGLVHKTGDESVAGVKTFASSPRVPTPLASQDLATKQYVDDQMLTTVKLSGSYADPAWMQSLSANKLTGTLADALIPSTVARIGVANTWSAAQNDGALHTFGAGITGTGTMGALTLGSGALGTANTWTAAQNDSAVHTFNAGITGTGSTGALTLGSGALAAANSWTAAQTQTIENGTYYADLAAGANAGAKIQTVLTSIAAFPRGRVDARGLTGNQTFASFTMLPGHEVGLGSTTASVTGTITAREGTHLFGQSGHFNGTSGGTLLRADATLVGPMIYLAATNAGDWLHGTRVHDLNLDGNKANAATATNCIEVHDPMGEASKLRDLYIQGCKSSGVYFAGGLQANAVLDTVSSFANGVYGFDFNNVGAATTLISPSGDDNGTALIHWKGNGTARLQIVGLKAESKGAGLQPAVIVAESSQSTPTRINILGGEAGLSAGGNPTDLVKIVGSYTVCVHIEGLRADTTGYANVINDTVNSVIVPLSRFAGGYVPELDYCPGNTNYAAYGGGVVLGNNVPIKAMNAAGTVANTAFIPMDGSNRVLLQNTSNHQMQFSASSFGYWNGSALVWSGDSNGKGTFNGGLVAGASGSTIADTRELMQSVHSCGTTTTCANTANGSFRAVFGKVTLASGTATVTGMTAWTSTSSFVCTGTDSTAAAAVKIANASTTSITITGTSTDVIGYTCIGN